MDSAIVGKVISDLTSPDFVAEALQVTKDLLVQDHSVEIQRLKSKDEGIEKQISEFWLAKWRPKDRYCAR